MQIAGVRALQRAQVVASVKRGVRRLERRERRKNTAAENSRRRLRTLNLLVLAVSLGSGAIDCRERSAETENVLPPYLVEGSESVKRLEWPTAENTRRRQRTLYPLVSSKALALGSRLRISGSADRAASRRAE